MDGNVVSCTHVELSWVAPEGSTTEPQGDERGQWMMTVYDPSDPDMALDYAGFFSLASALKAVLYVARSLLRLDYPASEREIHGQISAYVVADQAVQSARDKACGAEPQSPELSRTRLYLKHLHRHVTLSRENHNV